MTRLSMTAGSLFAAARGMLAGSVIGLAVMATAAHAEQAPAAQGQPIDLTTALRLAGANNLDLALTREAERQAKAASDAATLSFFPWLQVGQIYARRTGNDQQTTGVMVDVDRQLYRRGASFAIAIDLGDALFRKLAALQLQNAAVHNVDAQRNDALLAAANAYFDLVNSVAEIDIARDAVRISHDYQDQLDRAVAIGLTNRSEALRVAVRTQENEVTLRAAEAQQRRDSAALAVVLRLDPKVALEPRERVVMPLTLVPLDTPLDRLVARALELRPEVEASTAAITAAEHQRTAAKYAPLIPSISAAATYAQTRGGPNGILDAYQPTHDYVVGLNWRFGPGGLFDFSRTEAAESVLARQRISAEKLRQSISQQVVDALSAAQAARDQMVLARKGVQLAEQSLKLSTARREFGVYVVLEVIQAQQDLTRARSNYAAALAQFAKAQYSLARATGNIGD
ncbi:MAG: TolC family protein [Steroidobacteraceae bacterium]